MRCPTCDVDLIENGRLGVRNGYCPECQGEWFARGAVDRLLDRAAAAAANSGDGERDGDEAPAPASGDRIGSDHRSWY